MDASIKAIKTDWGEIIASFKGLDDLKREYQKEVNTFSEFLPIYPPSPLLFRCFGYFNSKDTKVVILGQDPYHGAGQATGLCFAVEDGTKPPPSLRNINKCLLKDIGSEWKSSSLENWANQGVLLLNASLCVRQKSPGSCMKMWSSFTSYIIDYINRECSHVVFVAWGAFAFNLLQHVDKEKHCLLVSSHPSPLSAHRGYKTYPSFMNSRPFSKITELTGVQWT